MIMAKIKPKKLIAVLIIIGLIALALWVTLQRRDNDTTMTNDRIANGAVESARITNEQIQNHN